MRNYLPDSATVHVYALEFRHLDQSFEGLVYVGITWGKSDPQRRIHRHLQRTTKESRKYLPPTNQTLVFAGIIAVHRFGEWPDSEADILRSYEAAGWCAPQVNKYCQWPLVHTPEALEKIGAAHRGKPLTLQHRANISAGEKGKPHRPEHVAAIAAALTGKRLTEEHRAHLSASSARKGQPGTWVGRHHTEDSKRKMSDAKKGKASPHSGYIPSKETRGKLSEALRGKRHFGIRPSAETRAKMSRSQKERHARAREKVNA